MDSQSVEDLIVTIPDYPRPGVAFKDLTPIFSDPRAFAHIVNLMSEQVRKHDASHIVGIEARGFILGAAIALQSHCGFVPVRKKGKLPRETFEAEYTLEYGTDVLEIHRDSLPAGARVFLVDDVLATGGTVGAALDLVEQCGAEAVGFGVLLELDFLSARDKLAASHPHLDVWTFLHEG